MNAPLWVSIIVGVIAGLFAAVVAPLVTTGLARRTWRSHKLLELKYQIFQGATDALAAWSTDALDPQLQSNKQAWKGMARAVEMRPSTAQALEQHRGLVAAFFSSDVARKFDEAVRADVSLDNIPNVEFDAKRVDFIRAASAELGLGSE